MSFSLRFPKLVVVSVIFLFAAATGIHLVYAQSEDPGQIELGAVLFAENCAVCHGDDGQGRVGATLAKDWPSIRPDLRMRAVIANGIPGFTHQVCGCFQPLVKSHAHSKTKFSVIFEQ